MPAPPERAARALESAYCVIVLDIAPVEELYAIPAPADNAALALESVYCVMLQAN